MNYGFPYKGSKNKIAETIIDFLPKAEHFYDLFAGGFAITHAALVNKKYKSYYANDLNKQCIDLFKDAIQGKFRNETRWISREQFYQEKEKNPYVAFIWSFGNIGRGYLYARDLEPYKKAWHDAIFYNRFVPMYELTGVDLRDIAEIEDIHKKYLSSKKYLKDELENRLQSLESLERLKRLKRLERLEINNLSIFNKSYDEIEILPDSVIYCDIPYINTNCYGKKNIQTFDFDSFYKWAAEQKEIVFISSYWMPDGFIPVKEIIHRSTLCATKNNKVIEKIFIPEHQMELFNQRKKHSSIQLELF